MPYIAGHFRKRSTNHRALLQKMTCKYKASYGSSPLDIMPLSDTQGQEIIWYVFLAVRICVCRGDVCMGVWVYGCVRVCCCTHAYMI